MKAAIYINEGLTQVVLTPDNEWERSALKMISAGSVQTFYGQFYECQGGWMRETNYRDQNDSLIFRINKPEPAAPNEVMNDRL